MTKLVEQDANERFGAEHLGPFGKRQRLEVLRGQEVVQPGRQVRRARPGSLPWRDASG